MLCNDLIANAVPLPRVGASPLCEIGLANAFTRLHFGMRNPILCEEFEFAGMVYKYG
jgi:hypothetical protein